MVHDPEANRSVVASTNPAITNMERLGSRLGRLEETVDQLIATHKTLMEKLQAEKQEDDRKLMPSPNTKYFDFLVYLEETFKGSQFTSDEIPKKSRHILSILNTEYKALDVVSKRGRTNVYTVSPQVREKIESQETD